MLSPSLFLSSGTNAWLQQELREVSFRGNRMVDASIAGRAMSAIKTLKKLDLSRNSIEELRQDSFVDVISLEELDLVSILENFFCP